MIPVISIGKGVTGAVRYIMGQGNHPVTGERLQLGEGEESRAEILGGQNFGIAIENDADLDLARRMMEWNALPENQASKGKKCVRDAFHASLSWEKGQNPTKAEMVEAAQNFLKSMGMEGAQALFVAHSDTAHRHLHIAASRVDPATGKTYSDGEILIKSQAWALKWERDHGQRSQNESRQQLHKMIDAIEARDGAAVVAVLTERTPTFTGRELDKMLAYGMADKRELAAFKAEILAQPNVIGLREDPAYAEGAEASAGRDEKAVYRYTTREVLAAEMALLRSAQRLAGDHSHGVGIGRTEATAAAFTLKPEQVEALAHLTGAEGFAMLWGEAGTGKSHTLNAARAAYEAEGCKVVGLSWTNDIVQQMRGDGFADAATIASELKKIESGRGNWNANTVLIVDEAAMISTENLSKLTAAAGNAGAKLILAGDDAQLASIERGGMFETLRQTHGAAILSDVQRVADAGQKTAFGKMHRGEFLDALKTFDQAGGIHWAEKPTEALRGMAQKYTADVAADPAKKRFMFAFTNAEVDALNEYARARHRERGALGIDHTLATASGAQEFAAGDRVQFTGTGAREQKKQGLVNGRVGTITGIEVEDGKARVTVALDTAKGKAPQSVSFVVGANAEAGEFDKLKLGYAGTIYRGQGRTLDQSYVAHSAQWRSSAAYVALTRHRESVHIFAATETARAMDKGRRGFEHGGKEATLDPAAFAAAEKARDLASMARGMGRKESNKRAASAYRIAEAHLARAGFGQAAEEAPQRAATRQTRRQQAAPTQAAPPPAAAIPLRHPPSPRLRGTGGFGGQESKATERGAYTGRAAPDAGAVVKRGARRMLSALAESILKTLMGESPAPPRRQSADEDRPTREQQQQQALDALARAQGLGRPVISEQDLRMQEETSKKNRDRDRGGGQSL